MGMIRRVWIGWLVCGLGSGGGAWGFDEVPGAEVTTDPIRVQFSTPVPSIWWGNPLPVNFEIENTGQGQETFDVWLALSGDGAVYFDNPVGGPFPFVMEPGAVANGSAEFSMPPDFTHLEASLCMEAGVFGEEVRAFDCADFLFESPLLVEFTAVDSLVRQGEKVLLEYMILNRRPQGPVSFTAEMHKYLIGGDPAPDNPAWGPKYYQAVEGGGFAGNAGWPVGEFVEIGGPYMLCLVIAPAPYTREMTTCIEYYVEP